jgi:hypothetical protein
MWRLSGIWFCGSSGEADLGILLVGAAARAWLWMCWFSVKWREGALR